VTVLAWSLYVVWCAATIMWAIDPKTAASGAATIAQLLLLYTIISMAPLTRNDLRTVIGAAIAGGVVAGLYGAWTFHNQLGWELSQLQEQVVRLQLSNGTNSVDPNHFADSLLFPLIAAVVFALRDRALWRKLLFSLAAGSMLAGIYFAGSRESLLAFAIAVVYVLVMVPRFRAQGLVLVGGALAMGAALPTTWQRFGDVLANGGTGRFAIWRTGLDALPSYWMGGAGIRNFSNAYDQVYPRIYMQYEAGWHRAPHDLLLQTLIELGIVGVAVLGVALAAQFSMLGPVEGDLELSDYRVMMQAAMIALMFAALFIDMMMYKYLWFLFATMSQLHGLWATTRPPARASGLVTRLCGGLLKQDDAGHRPERGRHAPVPSGDPAVVGAVIV
jgi:O-antigen ligase